MGVPMIPSPIKPIFCIISTSKRADIRLLYLVLSLLQKREDHTLLRIAANSRKRSCDGVPLIFSFSGNS